MSGEIEAAGAAVTAGLVGAAVEGKGSGVRDGTGACLNCGTTLDGAWCKACGQPADISRTMRDVVQDFLHGLLHLDTKTWRTLPLLIARPGTLTHDYIHGRRARYISPLALFLFTVFLMFFAFSFVEMETGAPAVAQVRERLATTEDVAAARARLERAEAGLAAARTALSAAAPEDRADAQEDLDDAVADVAEAKEALTETAARLARQRAALEKASAELAAVTVETDGRAAAAVAGRAKTAVDELAQRQEGGPRVGVTVEGAEPPEGVRWQDALREEVEAGRVNINMGDERLNARVRQNLLNPDLALYRLQETTSKFSFLLVPISLPFIALLFLWKRNVTLFDHVVFSLYSLSFMSLLFAAVAALARLGEAFSAPAALLATFAPPVHLFFHLKGTYALRWFSALWRMVFLLVFVVIAATLFFVAMLYLGLAA